MRKIYNGTPVHDGPSLCLTCRCATVVKGMRIDEEFISCNMTRGRVRFKVTSCSDYDNKATPTLGAMQEIAWQLRTSASGKRIGFLSPTEAKRRKDLTELPWLDSDA